MARWQLRVSVNGVSKSVDVESTARVSELASSVTKAFHVEAVTLCGGFPPKKFDPDSIVGDVTSDRALLRGVVPAPQVPKATKKKPATTKPAESASKKTKKPATTKESENSKKQKRVKGLGTAEGLMGAVNGSKKGLFFREALQGALAGAYETSRANDRFLSTISKDAVFTTKSQRLDGGISTLQVSFPETSAGARTKRRHSEDVDFIPKEALGAVLKEALRNGEADMLRPDNIVRCSPQVFWNLIYHHPEAALQEAFQSLLPTVDWETALTGGTVPVPDSDDDDEPPPAPQRVVVDDQRAARLRAAEERSRPPQHDALLGCLQGDTTVLAILQKANIKAPRDLALWCDSGDLLHDILRQSNSPNDNIPSAARLNEFAAAAAAAAIPSTT